MIHDVVTSKGVPAVTSDRWHVVLSQFNATTGERPFSRGIVSEHNDRIACQKAADALRDKLVREAGGAVPERQRVQVFARPPRYKSLKLAKHRRARES